MKKTLIPFMMILVSVALLSCGRKKTDNNIIMRKPAAEKTDGTKKMGDYKQSRQIDWVGSVYTVDVDFYADTSLPIVSDGVQKFFDNRVKVRIIRKDGTDFFNKTFSKSNFLSYLSSSLGKNGALLGVVFDRAEGDYLYFAASIGSPDKSSDEYVPLIVRVSRFGDVYISKDTMLDTGSDVEIDGRRCIITNRS